VVTDPLPSESIGLTRQSGRHSIEAVGAFWNNDEVRISVGLVPAVMHVDAIIGDRIKPAGDKQRRRKILEIGVQRPTTQIGRQRGSQPPKVRERGRAVN
jgi:hypothetical protein